MVFDVSRVYTMLNADELKVGDTVVVAHNLNVLKQLVSRIDCPKDEIYIWTIKEIRRDIFPDRFVTGLGIFPLVYLLERAENCTNCVHRERAVCKSDVSPINCCPCYDREIKQSYIEPETPELVSLGNGQYEEKAEPKYRPFKDTAELIQAWVDKGGKWQKRELIMPLIWVKYKERGNKELITVFKGDKIISTEFQQVDMQGLFKDFTFLDGSPCGVEVKE